MLTNIQLTPEGSIVIDGVKVGEYSRFSMVSGEPLYTGDINTTDGKRPIVWLDWSDGIDKIINRLLTSGFTPQKWEE